MTRMNTSNPFVLLTTKDLTMSKFTRKEETVEAMKYSGSEKSAKAIMAWAGTRIFPDKKGLNCAGRRGLSKIKRSDWVVRDDCGLHVYTDEEFTSHYSEVKGAPAKVKESKVEASADSGGLGISAEAKESKKAVAKKSTRKSKG